MDPGALVSGRFRIEREVGSGGMGTVFRALDEVSGTYVALKALRHGVPEGADRFSREVSALARLSHPSIVRYVAHGEKPPFVAMEWLEGEDLAQRLRNGALPIREAIEIAARTADAIDHAHGLGVVHRDIKPSNLFFEHGDVSRLRVVDFGLAYIPDDLGFKSSTGVLLGTPGYMAPEQVRGEVVDARADVFSLACVLYRCLTGHGPFSAPGDAVATLAKMLFQDPEPASSLRRDIPEALDELLSRALSKERAQRPPTARAFAEELRRIDQDEETSGRPMTAPPSSAVLTDRERRILSVVVAAREGLGDELSTLRCEAEAMFVERQQALRDIAAMHGARLEILPVAIVALLDGRGSATDRAAAAARLALALRDVLGGVPIALATGSAELKGRAMGDVIDRAVAAVTAKDRPKTTTVKIDATTAGLLGPAFVVKAADGGALELESERASTMQVRTLLGKPTPCVGRDRELSFLDATLAECENDDVARCVVVTALAGVGKSRLRYEWLRKIGDRDVEVWTSRADPMTAGAPFSLLAQIVSRAAGIDASDSQETARARLVARLSRTLPRADVAQVAEFLGEVIGARFSDEGRVQLRAARQDALLMSDQVRRAWEAWVGAEARAQPLVIVLEDLHWGDLPTVQLVDYALGAHKDLPIMVLGLARPEVKDVFPSLWQKRRVIELQLNELTPKASARLARHVLGDGVDDATIERVVAKSAGNAFFLEEILRAVAEGRGDDVPETVLAMVQRRLDALPPESRRVLRAASVFGETFWRGAVSAHLGAQSSPMSRVEDRIDELVQSELLTRRDTSRFAGEEELTFRHALVRDAAYATLTDDDRALAHRLAGTWLEEHGERDAAVLARHFDRGGEAARAVPHYVRAAVQALEGSDLDRVLAHAERGAELGAAGADLGELRRVQAEALRWRGRIAESEAAARDATELLPPATSSWYIAVAELGTASGALAHLDSLSDTLKLLLSRGDERSPELATSLARLTMQLYACGHRESADEGLARIATLDLRHAGPVALARIEQAHAFRALFESDHGTYYERMKDARALFDAAGDRRNATVQAANMGYVAVALGALDEAERELVPAARTAEALGMVRIRAIFQQNLGLLRFLQSKYDEAIAYEEESAPVFEQQGDPRLAAFSLVYLAMALAARGDLERAREVASRAVKMSEPQLPAHASALAHLADIELAMGDKAPALEHASAGYAILEKLGGLEDTESSVRVIYCDALVANGREDDAKKALAVAVAGIRSRASKIKSERWRETFLGTPENRRTFALADELGVT